MNRRHDDDRNRGEMNRNERRSEGRDFDSRGDYGNPGRGQNRGNYSEPQGSRSQSRRLENEPISENRYDTGWGDYESPRGRDYYRGGGRENDYTQHGRSGGYQDSGRYAEDQDRNQWNEGPWDQSRSGSGGSWREQGNRREQGRYGNEQSRGNWDETSNRGPGQGQESSRSDNRGRQNLSGPAGRQRSGWNESEWAHGYNEPNQPRGNEGDQWSRQNADTGYENNYGGFGGYSSGGRGTSSSRGGGYNPSPDFDRYDRYSSWSSPGSTEDTNSYRQGWNESGPHAGRGPKNYERSDEKIKDEVCEALTYNSYIDPSEVEVDVEDGKVHLKGKIGSRRDKKMIEDVIDPVRGVKDVRNELEIDDSGSSSSRLSSSEESDSSSQSESGSRTKKSQKSS